MHIKKSSYVLFLCIVCTMFLAGCAQKQPSEKEMAEDLNQSEAIFMTISETNESLPVDKIMIDKSQVEKKAATYWCSAQQSNDDYACDTGYKLEYIYYDKGGWMLENYDMTSVPEIRPLKGINEEGLRDAYLEKYNSVEFVTHDTDLDTKTDHTVIRLSDSADDFTSTGELTLDWEFASNGWAITSRKVVPDQSVVTADEAVESAARNNQIKSGTYKNLQLISRQTDLNAGKDTFLVGADQVYPNAVNHVTFEITYECTDNFSWREIENEIVDQSLSWTIEGEWDGYPGLTGYPYRLHLTVHDVTDTGVVVSLSTYTEGNTKIEDVLANTTVPYQVSESDRTLIFQPSVYIRRSSEYFRVGLDEFDFLDSSRKGIGLSDMRRS